MRRRPRRLRRDRSDRAVPDVHVAAAVGRRQAHVQLRVRAGRAHVRVHVGPAVGHDRLAGGHVHVHVLRARLLVLAGRAGRPAGRLRQPEERVRRPRRPGGRPVEQLERGPRLRRHVRQLRSEIPDGLSVRDHMRPLHAVHTVLNAPFTLYLFDFYFVFFFITPKIYCTFRLTSNRVVVCGFFFSIVPTAHNIVPSYRSYALRQHRRYPTSIKRFL